MRQKKELIDRLIACGRKLISPKKIDKAKKLQDYLLDKYNLPTGTVADYYCERVDLNGISEYNLFIYTDGMSQIFPNEIKPADYFVDVEIKEYSKTTINTQKKKFPIEISCVQVSENQWIGVADVEFFINLRKSSMINYNANTQRVLQKTYRGGIEYWKISTNLKAIDEIKTCFREKTYIPNTITLNIPHDVDYDFKYENGVLKIKQLEHFDITDGYHRYIAMTQLYDEEEFNCNMELRITNFDEETAKQFIFQEDQKTKMTKVESESMNVNKEANIICENLNSSMMFDLKGKISRNEGIIDFATLSYAIDKLYYNGKKGTAKYRNDVTKEIKDWLKYLIEINPEEFLEKTYSDRRIIAVMICIKYLEDKSKMEESIYKLEKHMEDYKYSTTQALIQKKINTMINIIN